MTRAEGVWIWPSLTAGVGARTARRLVEFFGSEEALWAATQRELAEAAGASLAQKLIASRSGDAVNAHVRGCRAQGITLLTPASPGYPAGLLDLCDPPCALYARGDLSLLARECITVVGTRRHTRYGARIDMKKRIPVCAAYEVDGQITHEFPFPVLLDQAKPVTEYLPGWHCDITAARKWEDLPKEAQDYVNYIEKAVGCRIAYISVGPDRDACIRR